MEFVDDMRPSRAVFRAGAVAGPPAEVARPGRRRALGAVGLAPPHKLCHTLGGSFDLPHARTPTAVPLHAVAHEAAPEAMARRSRAPGGARPAGGTHELARGRDAPLALESPGPAEADPDVAADPAARNPYDNLAAVTGDGLRALQDDAFHGRRPRAPAQPLHTPKASGA